MPIVSDRKVECLSSSAGSKTDREIATIIGSRFTVIEHLAAVCEKSDAAKR